VHGAPPYRHRRTPPEEIEMNAPEKPFLADIQAHPDHRSMAVDRVDVRSIRHPIGIERAYDPPKFVEDRKRDVPIAHGAPPYREDLKAQR
jgi:GTP cyclohydrolase FolE2